MGDIPRSKPQGTKGCYLDLELEPTVRILDEQKKEGHNRNAVVNKAVAFWGKYHAWVENYEKEVGPIEL